MLFCSKINKSGISHCKGWAWTTEGPSKIRWNWSICAEYGWLFSRSCEILLLLLLLLLQLLEWKAAASRTHCAGWWGAEEGSCDRCGNLSRQQHQKEGAGKRRGNTRVEAASGTDVEGEGQSVPRGNRSIRGCDPPNFSSRMFQVKHLRSLTRRTWVQQSRKLLNYCAEAE